MECAKCKVGIRGETGIRCEGVCGRIYHLALKCSGLDNYTEVKLKEINMLRYMCADCVVYIQNIDGILKETHKALEKNNKYLREYKREFDLAIANNEKVMKKIMDDMKITFDAKLKEIEKIQNICVNSVTEIGNINKTAENIKENSKKICIELENNKSDNKRINEEIKRLADNNKSLVQKMTFAEIAKASLPDKKNDKPLIIKPKSKQNNEKTKSDLNKKIDPVDFKISNVLIKKNGVAVVESTNDNERNKIKQVMEEKLNNEYEIKIPGLSKPRFIIAKMSYKCNDELLIEKLKKQNECIVSDEIKVVKQYEVKKGSGFFYNAIIETNVDTYKKVLSMEKLNIGWDRCRVYDDLSILCCFKCRQYGHKVAYCKNEDICIKCLKNHKTADCNNEPVIKCINCAKMNESRNLGLDDNHRTNSKMCPVYLRKLEEKRRRINY